MDLPSQMQTILVFLEEEKRLPLASELGLTTESYAVLLEPMVNSLRFVEGIEIVKNANGNAVDIRNSNARLTSEGRQVYEIGKLTESNRIIL